MDKLTRDISRIIASGVLRQTSVEFGVDWDRIAVEVVRAMSAEAAFAVLTDSAQRPSGGIVSFASSAGGGGAGPGR